MDRKEKERDYEAPWKERSVKGEIGEERKPKEGTIKNRSADSVFSAEEQSSSKSALLCRFFLAKSTGHSLRKQKGKEGKKRSKESSSCLSGHKID